MRLRQIALVAKDLERAGEALKALLDLGEPFQDPGVETYGLRNLVFAAGEDFLEIVSPTRPDATAARYLAKRGGDGGYMVILQTRDRPGARARLLAAGARVVDERDHGGASFMHIHPKDVGGAILSVDVMTPDDRWAWAGPDWRERRGRPSVAGLLEARLEVADPPGAAARWSQALGAPFEARGAEALVLLDRSRIRFTPLAGGGPEGLCGIVLRTDQPEGIARRGRELGLPVDGGRVILCGVGVEGGRS